MPCNGRLRNLLGYARMLLMRIVPVSKMTPSNFKSLKHFLLKNWYNSSHSTSGVRKCMFVVTARSTLMQYLNEAT